MVRLSFRGAFAAAAVAVASLASATGVHAQSAVGYGNERAAVEITPVDLAASRQKVETAFNDLLGTWSATFKQIGDRFNQPRLRQHREPLRSACGMMPPSNASYCDRDNTVYYDDLFLAAQMKDAADALGTDGDMAAVQIIAHEVGHAVAFQLGHRSRKSYDNEATADCLAGAFAQTSRMRGALEQGDLEEAGYAISLAGDAPLQLTGDARVDRRLKAEAALHSHGTADQRWANFTLGLNGGAGACLPEFRSA